MLCIGQSVVTFCFFSGNGSVEVSSLLGQILVSALPEDVCTFSGFSNVFAQRIAKCLL